MKKGLKNGVLSYEVFKIIYQFNDENHEKSRLLSVCRRWRLLPKKPA